MLWTVRLVEFCELEIAYAPQGPEGDKVALRTPGGKGDKDSRHKSKGWSRITIWGVYEILVAYFEPRPIWEQHKWSGWVYKRHQFRYYFTIINYTNLIT